METATSIRVESEENRFPEWLGSLVRVLMAIACFHVASPWAPAWPLVMAYLGILAGFRRASSIRWALYPAWGVGIGVFAIQTHFLWAIFGISAVALWAIVALWHGLFAMALRQIRIRWGERLAIAMAPVIWVSQEYLRSELNPLKFAWLTTGSVIPVPIETDLGHAICRWIVGW